MYFLEHTSELFNLIFSHKRSLVPLSLTTGIKFLLCAFFFNLIIDSIKSSINSILFSIKYRLLLYLASCTLLKAPLPALFKQAFIHPSLALEQKFLPDSLDGDKYKIPVK